MADSLLDIWGMRKRAARDQGRHMERIKKALKENLRDLIADTNIITSDGKRKVRIPMKFLDSYRFKHADNKNDEEVGQGNKKNKPGDAIAKDGSGEGSGDKAGDQEGEDIYEQEVSVEEIINMMFEDLNLPWLEQKIAMEEVETDNIVFHDISTVGSMSNIDRRRTIKENIKRNAKKGKAQFANIQKDDLRYKIWDIEKEYHSNAAVYLLLDRSGSMDDDKKYIAKSFFFWLVHFLRSKYTNVKIIFVAHTTTAQIVEEKDFFSITSSGGTKCSSAFELALEDIEKNHPPDTFNNYVFEFSDGDNWGDDNNYCIELIEKLLNVCSAVGYGEINTDSVFYGGWSNDGSTLHKALSGIIKNKRFLSTKIEKKEDIYECLKEFLKIKEE